MKFQWIPNLEQLTVFLDFLFVTCKIDWLFSNTISSSDNSVIIWSVYPETNFPKNLSYLGHWEMALHYLLCCKWLPHLWVILTENSFKEPAVLLYILWRTTWSVAHSIFTFIVWGRVLCPMKTAEIFPIAS